MRLVRWPTTMGRFDRVSKQADGPVEILFYYRQECDLCEQMEFEIREYLSTFHPGSDIRVRMRDVDDDRQWYDKYSEHVPALVVNGEQVCHYFLDCDKVRLALDPDNISNPGIME